MESVKEALSLQPAGHLLNADRCSIKAVRNKKERPVSAEGRRPQWAAAPRLKCSSTVALVLSNSHCWLAADGLQAFMKTRRSPALLSIQLLLTGW